MAYPMSEAKPGPLRVDFDRRLKVEFHGSKINSDDGLRPRPAPCGRGMQVRVQCGK